ncbi:hypothetical protein C480_03429 [Natrialba aegyptia DSM 13077]|uniref:Uncharacterized protein n=1 Tax=Natrialba aegyptia DSM 13077 TaxID=1227491 RepID=M0BC46_9EURY|nr:hypothetical protein C480_03429 [Natrialba aegyptia DSM 13077]
MGHARLQGSVDLLGDDPSGSLGLETLPTSSANAPSQPSASTGAIVSPNPGVDRSDRHDIVEFLRFPHGHQNSRLGSPQLRF